jgi:hypothetical protein
LSCPFLSSRAAGRGRVSYEVGGRSICLADFRQPTGAGRLSFSHLSRTSLSGLWRLAPCSQMQSSTGTGWRETVRKYRKGIGGMKKVGEF